MVNPVSSNCSLVVSSMRSQTILAASNHFSNLPKKSISKILEYLDFKSLLEAEPTAKLLRENSEISWEAMDQRNPQWAACKNEKNKKKWNVILTKIQRVICLKIIHLDDNFLIFKDKRLFQEVFAIYQKYTPLIRRFPSYGCYFEHRISNLLKKIKEPNISFDFSILTKEKRNLKKLVDSEKLPIGESLLMMLLKLDELNINKETKKETRDNVKKYILDAFRQHDSLVIDYINIFVKQQRIRGASRDLMDFFKDCALELSFSHSCQFLDYLVENFSFYDEQVNGYLSQQGERLEMDYFKAIYLMKRYQTILEQQRLVDQGRAHQAISCAMTCVEKFSIENLIPVLNPMIDRIVPICLSYKDQNFLHQVECLFDAIKEKFSVHRIPMRPDNFPLVYFTMADIKHKINKYSEALVLFDQAIEIIGDSIDIEVFKKAAYASFKLNDFIKAETYLERLFKLVHPKMPINPYLMLAEVKFRLKKFSEAESMFEDVFDRSEDFRFPHAVRIFILNQYALEDFEIVQSLGETSMGKLKLLPFELEEGFNLSIIGIAALMNKEIEKYEEAEKLFFEEIERFKNNRIPTDSVNYASLYFLTAQNAYQLEKYEEAVNLFDQAIQIFNDRVSFEVLIKAGWASQKLNDCVKAESLWDMALQKDIDQKISVLDLCGIGENKFKLGKFKEAEIFFLKAYKNRGCFSGHFLRIFILNEFRLENFKIIAEFDSAFLEEINNLPYSLESDFHVSIHGMIAISKFKTQDYKKAEKLIEKEKKRFFDSSYCSDKIAFSHLAILEAQNKYQLEKYDEAAASFNKAINSLEKEAVSIELLLNAGWAYRKSNDFPRAEALWDEVLKKDCDKKISPYTIIEIAENKIDLEKFQEASDHFLLSIKSILSETGPKKFKDGLSLDSISVFIMNEMRLKNFKNVSDVGGEILRRFEEDFPVSVFGWVAIAKHKIKDFIGADILFDYLMLASKRETLSPSLIAYIALNKFNLGFYSQAAPLFAEAIQKYGDACPESVRKKAVENSKNPSKQLSIRMIR